MRVPKWGLRQRFMAGSPRMWLDSGPGAVPMSPVISPRARVAWSSMSVFAGWSRDPGVRQLTAGSRNQCP
jgi:hypothetical protein